MYRKKEHQTDVFLSDTVKILPPKYQCLGMPLMHHSFCNSIPPADLTYFLIAKRNDSLFNVEHSSMKFNVVRIISL